MFRSILLISALVAANPALAGDAGWRDVTPKLQGCWDGTGMGGEVSECWLVADDGRADGMFLLRKDDAPTFAEILTIDDFGDGVEMRLKHVNPDMTGWEEKNDYTKFSLVSVEPNKLIFKGLTLIFDSEDTLTIELAMRFGDGDVRTAPFNFARTATLDRAAD